MTDETVLTDDHEFTYEGVRLDAGTRADHGPPLYFDKRPDKNVIAKRAAVKITGFGYDYTRPERNIDDTCPANVRRHLTPPNKVR
jgi:hypothetical protein